MQQSETSEQKQIVHDEASGGDGTPRTKNVHHDAASAYHTQRQSQEKKSEESGEKSKTTKSDGKRKSEICRTPP